MGLSLTGRALLSLAFLFGFYVLAVGSVVALVLVNLALYQGAGRGSSQLVLVTVFVAFAVIRGIFFISRADKDEADPGVPVDERSQPELIGLIRSVAQDMGTPPPTRIFLVPDVNAAVWQTGGLLGLRKGHRSMMIGVPLIEALTVDELRGVIAHEFGHYAGGDTLLGGLTYRAAGSIGRTIHNLGPESHLGRVLEAYGAFYLRMSLRVRRQQELSADAAAVRLAGRRSHTSALRKVAAGDAAFTHYVESYLIPLWGRGCDVPNAFEGYRRLLEHPENSDELEEAELAARLETSDPYDSHPSLTERLAHAVLLPEDPCAGADPRPALRLLRDADEIEGQVGAYFTRKVTGQQMERTVDWDAAAPVYASGFSKAGVAFLKAAGTVFRDDEEDNLAAAVALIEAGYGERLATVLTGPLEKMTPEERAEYRTRMLRDHLACALGVYLVGARGHRWAVCWSGPLGVADGKGTFKDLFAMAASLVEDPASAPRLRRALGGEARMRKFSAAHVELPVEEPKRELPGIVAVVADVAANRRNWDLVLTTASLVLHPVPGAVRNLLRRMLSSQGVGAPAAQAAKRRIDALFDRPADEVLGRYDGAVAIPIEAITGLRKRRGGVVQVDAKGAERPWNIRCASREQRDALLTEIHHLVVDRFGAAPAQAAA